MTVDRSNHPIARVMKVVRAKDIELGDVVHWRGNKWLVMSLDYDGGEYTVFHDDKRQTHKFWGWTNVKVERDITPEDLS